MKLIKGKKSADEKDKKQPAKPAKQEKIPEPPAPVRIQIEPRKASNISLEVAKDKSGKKAAKPSVTVSIFDSAAPSRSPKAPKKQKPVESKKPAAPVKKEAALIPKPKPVEKKEKPAKLPIPISDSKLQAEPQDIKKLRERIDFFDKSFGVMVREVNNLKTRIPDLPDRKQIDQLKKIAEKREEPARVSDSEIKSIRQFTAKSDYLDNQIAGLKVNLNNRLETLDTFTQRVNSIQKDLGDIKIKLASSKELKADKEISELKERMDEMESLLAKFSDRFREYKPGKPMAPDTKEMKTVIDKISGMEGEMKTMKEKILSMNNQIAGLGESKPQPQGADFSPDLAKNISDRLDTFDSRITGITDKLMKLGEDMQKLTSYFMEGIKHIEARINVMEKEKEAQSRLSAPESGSEFVPTTYRSHLKREPEEEVDTEEDDYERPRRFLAPAGPKVAMPQPPPKPPSVQPAMPGPSFGRDYSQSPVTGPTFGRNEPPPAPVPDRGNMFTKLRESTVIRRPIPQEDPDMDILMEHISESRQKQESREKIQRDLLNAGFEQDLINKAFMRFRVG
ncbi:MAG: hypothetical protein NTY20_04480 [Candidatus Aenigmarchaeota archaeon]|nr:hypothetical protein [Candidatus Aenigmarchaeota archaeon]